MSSPCLSSVLTHANLAVYQTTLPEALPATYNTNGVRYRSAHRVYSQISPHSWTAGHVLEWISDLVESTKFDATTLCLDFCSMDGASLCHLSQEQMTGIFGPQLGPQLHQNLQEHKTKTALQSLSGPELNETCQLLDHFLDNLSFPLLSTIRIGQADEVIQKDELEYQENYVGSLSLEPLTPIEDTSYQSDSEYSGMFGFASSSESGSSESEADFPYPPFMKMEMKREECEPVLRRQRGRPRKVSQEQSTSTYNGSKKSKHAPRGTHLWEFIRDILIHPEKNQGLMKWEDRREGVFKFLKSEAVAQMWGQKKKNSSMTYEKLSRAMRYYYKREILERVDGRRLVYKFGKNSSGWKMGEGGSM